MRCIPDFPKLSADDYERALRLPTSAIKPLRVVLDTDLDNEVDDWYALTWLLMQQQQPSAGLNRIALEAVTIEPYSFKTRLEALQAAYRIYLMPPAQRTPAEQAYLAPYLGQIEGILALGTNPYELGSDPHLNGSGDLGVQGSYDSALRIFATMGEPSDGRVFKGATEFMRAPYEPVVSEAAKRLVELAMSASPDDPLYVIAIACPTNVASAMLMAPEIIRNIVVVWDAGYPSNVTTLVNDSLNLDEDLYASQLLFSSGVPLVYVPGFYIAQQLNMSQADMLGYVRPSGAMGELLYQRYMHNPLFTFYGINPDDLFGRNWVLWDVANAAWVLSPGSVSSNLVTAPILTDSKMWQPNPGGHPMREAYEISVNAIFPIFERQLQARA